MYMKRLTWIILSITLFSFLFTACKSINGTEIGNMKNDTDTVNDRVVGANTEFAFNIFKKLNNEDSAKSIFISPLSISTALTMTYNGAEASTKEAISKTLGFKGINRDNVNQSYQNLLNHLEKADKKIELNVANSIWIRDGEIIKEDFLSKNKNNFSAEIDTLDFSKDSAVDTINKWISDATKGKIDKMLEPPISPEAVMYLINAIYFKGEWSNQFDPKKTFDGTFKTFSGYDQTVKMMSLKGKVEFANGPNYKAVRLPYGNGKTSMYCILPNEGININEFIEAMSIKEWNNLRKNISELDEVVLEIPKFKLEYGIKNLNDSLISLGMGEAFSGKANFSGIREDIFISQVLHRAVIEVTEEGSTAAAATIVELNTTSAMKPITFTANRPFIFFITDDTSGTIMFMGKLLNVN